MSHTAIVRSSARMAAHNKVKESQDQEATARRLSTNSIANNADNLTDELSQLSVISISSSDVGDLVREMKPRIRQVSETTSTSTKSMPIKTVQSPPRPMMAPLDRLITVADIEACVDGDLSQNDILNKLEDQWLGITNNFETVLDHLQECSDQVTDASNNCLQSLVDSIETTCDNVDNQVKALYHLMTKCDELTTKLSAAGSFRDEIKTLRKSVDTLENLYKSKPGSNQQRIPINQSAKP